MIPKLKKSKKINSWQSLFLSILAAILILVVIGFLVISNWRINQKRAELISKIEILKKEIQILEEKNQELRAKISQSKTREYLEKIAREKLGFIQPGEEMVVIKKEPKEEVKKEKSFWQTQFWWEWIKEKIR